ncbi:MAG: hypothetical protein IJC56_01070, partial [Clostridia bacterium]|nr:hypothetical protein [Clostridia bacterium]
IATMGETQPVAVAETEAETVEAAIEEVSVIISFAGDCSLGRRLLNTIKTCAKGAGAQRLRDCRSLFGFVSLTCRKNCNCYITVITCLLHACHIIITCKYYAVHMPKCI